MAGRRPTRMLYVLVGLLGFLFTITACAYGAMAFRSARSSDAYLAESDGGLMRVMREHGGKILGIEIAALAVAAMAAMASDRSA